MHCAYVLYFMLKLLEYILPHCSLRTEFWDVFFLLSHLLTAAQIPGTSERLCGFKTQKTKTQLTDNFLLVAFSEELHGRGSPPGGFKESLPLRVLPETPQDGGVGSGQGRQAHLVVLQAPGALLLPALHHSGGRPVRSGFCCRCLRTAGCPLHHPVKVAVEHGAAVPVVLLLV